MTDEERAPFTHFDAAIWTAGVTFVFLLVVSLVHGQSETIDVVEIAGVQVAVYLAACAFFSWRRPGRTFSELFAMRRTSFWLLLPCLLLGPALFGPAQTLGRALEHFAPESPDSIQQTLAALSPTTAVHGALFLLLLAMAGPLVEELLFRGAIYTALRPTFGVGSALWTASLCFTLSHPRPREWPAILSLALILSLLRAKSGSLWPAFAAHAGFNASQLAVLWSIGGKQTLVPLKYEIGGWVLSAALLAAVLLLARRNQLAKDARAVDDMPPPGGEYEG